MTAAQIVKRWLDCDGWRDENGFHLCAKRIDPPPDSYGMRFSELWKLAAAAGWTRARSALGRTYDKDRCPACSAAHENVPCSHCGRPADGEGILSGPGFSRLCYYPADKSKPDCYRRVVGFREPLGALRGIDGDLPPGVSDIRKDSADG